ncbi:hypothetical protein PTKIN_Ptkin05aG0186900 [Pterospermum kingtungense]
MSPTDSYGGSVANDPEWSHWNPTKECIFGVMIMIMTIMVVLFLKRSCSKLQPEPNPPPSYHSEWPGQQVENKVENCDVPPSDSDEVFVIMAGEQKPSCLAKPVASTPQPWEQV